MDVREADDALEAPFPFCFPALAARGARRDAGQLSLLRRGGGRGGGEEAAPVHRVVCFPSRTGRGRSKPAHSQNWPWIQ